MTADDVLNKEFLEIRCRILELAALFDRLDRAPGNVAQDQRLQRIRRGLEALKSNSSGRAEQVQLIFSQPYDENWQETYGVSKRS